MKNDIYDEDGYVYIEGAGWRQRDTIELHEVIEAYRDPKINSPYLEWDQDDC